MKQGATWRTPQGSPIGCSEKLKVLDQNLLEFKTLAQDMLEDAALMGCDVEQVRQLLRETIADLDIQYAYK